MIAMFLHLLKIAMLFSTDDTMLLSTDDCNFATKEMCVAAY